MGRYITYTIIEFPKKITKKVAYRLFLSSLHVVGKMSLHSTIYGYADIKKDSSLFRAHPYFPKKGCWYDWAYFKLDGYDGTIPGRITMIIDLSDCAISYIMDQDPYTHPYDKRKRIIPHLTMNNENISYLLFLGSLHIVRKLVPHSTIYGYRYIERMIVYSEHILVFLRRDVGIIELILNGMVMMEQSQE